MNIEDEIYELKQELTALKERVQQLSEVVNQPKPSQGAGDDNPQSE